jgi:hypothetical protein
MLFFSNNRKLKIRPAGLIWGLVLVEEEGYKERYRKVNVMEILCTHNCK